MAMGAIKSRVISPFEVGGGHCECVVRGDTIVEAGPHITVGHPNKIRVVKAKLRIFH